MRLNDRPLPHLVRTLGLTLAMALVPCAPIAAQITGKSVIIDGKPFVANGKVETDGKYIIVDGKPVMADGKPMLLDGRTVVIDGKTVSRAGTLNKAAPLLVFTIDLRWLGASPYRLEKDITTPIERAVKTLPGVLAVHSSNLSGRAQTRVSFDSKADASSTATAIRNRLDQIKRNLPRDASQPLIAWSRDSAP